MSPELQQRVVLHLVEGARKKLCAVNLNELVHFGAEAAR